MGTSGTDHGKSEAQRRFRRGWWAWLRLILLGVTLAGVVGFAMVLPDLTAGQVVLEEGDVAPVDIRAPRRLTYGSALLHAEAQAQAVIAIEPIYTPSDPSYARQQLGRADQVLDFLATVRADHLASLAQRQAYVLAVPELASFPSAALDALLSLPNEGWDRVRLETLAVLDQAMRREIRDGHLEEAREGVPTLVNLDLTGEETAVTIALVRRLLVPNSFLDAEATAEAQARARDSVGPVLRTLEADEIIVREGERVTALHIEAMDQFDLRQSAVRWPHSVGAGVLAVVSTSLLCLYLARFQPDVLWEGSRLLLMVLLLSAFVLAAGLMVPGGTILRYLSPAPALAMLAAATLGPHVGVASVIFLSGPSGTVADDPLETVTYVILGGLVAALTLGRVERISALFRAGACAALVHVLTVVVFRLPEGISDPGSFLLISLVAAANGAVSASLALGGLFLIGPMFDVPTTMRLIELSRPDNPLLQRLLREAPATYHHSLMVANLAEQAAERIGADPLLTRVGAYYHDVGKLARPYFFAENQVEGVNPHDRLDPHVSAEVIISHVRDGLELARRYRLPSRIQAFIPEHHGTNWVSFLYDKAVQQAGDTALVDERDFRHQGPLPQTKETALVMLADGCEATVRAVRPTSAEEVAEVVSRVISDRVADSQLGECDLTLRDLEIARAVFISALKGVFHPRIQYPKAEGGTDA